jgi:hypothetical protein
LVEVAEGPRAVAGARGGAERAQVKAEDAHRPGRWQVEPREDAQEARLAGAARPEHRQDLALRDRQRQPLQRRGVALGGRMDAEEVTGLDGGAHAASP